MPSPGPRSRRSGSSDRETRCRGRTAKGEPCQRRIRASAVVDSDDETNEALFCHDHKDQAKGGHDSQPQRPAKSSSPKKSRPQTKPTKTSAPAQKPSRPYSYGVSAPPANNSTYSITSLEQRLGLLSIHDPKPSPPPLKNSAEAGYLYGGQAEAGLGRRSKKSKHSFFCCCFSLCFGSSNEYDDDDHDNSYPQPARPNQQYQSPTRPRPPSSPAELVPNELPHETITKMQKDIDEGFSDKDKPGYIYIFWYNRSDQPVPSADAVRSALAATAHVNDDNAAPLGHYSNATTLHLKIGRAVDVGQRMKQWKAQCGIDVELLRFYPYVRGSRAEAIVVPHNTPHVGKVESLIHRELRGMGWGAPLEKCLGCGQTHQEWFKMDYTIESVRKVDAVIRKWIDWDRKLSGVTS